MSSCKDKLKLRKQEGYIHEMIESMGNLFSGYSENFDDSLETEVWKRSANTNENRSNRGCNSDRKSQLIKSSPIDVCRLSTDAVESWRKERQALSTHLFETLDCKARLKAEFETKVKLETKIRQMQLKKQKADRVRFLNKLELGMDDDLKEMLQKSTDQEIKDDKTRQDKTSVHEFDFRRPMQMVKLLDLADLEISKNVKETYTKLQGKPDHADTSKKILGRTNAPIDDESPLSGRD